MPPHDTDEENEVEMKCVEVLPEEDAEPEDMDDDDEDEVSLAPPAATAEIADDDDEEDSTEEDDTDSETETTTPAPVVAAPAPPKMRIKLKLPKAPSSSGTATATPASSSGEAPATATPATTKPTSSSASTAAANTTTTTSDPETVVVSVGGNKPKPNLPLKRVSPAGFLMKKFPSSSNANDTNSVGGNSSAGAGGSAKPKSRIRSLKLPLSKKASTIPDDDTGESLVRITPGGGTYTKRRSLHPSKPVRLPPIVSPGLLVQNGNNNNNNAKTSSAQLFDQAMEAAGYTDTSRTERPHRGSSIRRTVGDLFDSNVKLTMHFPPMVPPDVLSPEHSRQQNENNTTEEQAPKDMDGDVVMSDGNVTEHRKKPKFTADDLIEQLRDTMKSAKNKDVMADISFDDMLPVSLTAPLPETFIQERLRYVQAVEDREKAIVSKQEAEQEAEFNGTDPPKITVPPIPTPPEPPRLEEPTSTIPATTATGKHPLYPPRQASLVKHLDPQTFHITEGRYFGLFSNTVADPNFCGPNASGGAAGSALAVASSSSTGTPLTLSSVLFSNHPPATAAASGQEKSAFNDKAASAKASDPAAPTSASGEVVTAIATAGDEDGESTVATAQVVPSSTSTTKEFSPKEEVVVAATEVTSTGDEASADPEKPEPKASA